MGEGIVGHVAETGIPEIIGNTATENRYLIDDDIRYSELAVPILYKNKVIGVIDSENSRKFFFTKKHLNLFNTIAALAGERLFQIKSIL